MESLKIQQSQAVEYQQQIEDLRSENNQLQEDIDNAKWRLNWLSDKLEKLGQKNIDLTAIKQTNNSRSLSELLVDTDYWNKRQDVNTFLEAMISGKTKISEYDVNSLALPGEWDAIDITKSYWGKLKDNGIISLIAVGNLELQGEYFSQCNDSWLLVFYEDYENDKWRTNATPFALIFEPTDEGSFVIHIPPLPLETSMQYTEGYFYISPEDLASDIEGS
jgi:hypothetical protein